MSSKATALIATIAVALAAAAGGAYWYAQGRADRGEAISRLLQLSLPDSGGRPQRLSAWQGRVLVINFWATWCAPCREEMPGLIRTQRAYGDKGLQVIGIAIDSADKVAAFSRQLGVNYPLVVGGLEAVELARQLGNSAAALPFTVVLDRRGSVVKTHLGALQENDLVQLIRPLLA